MPQRTIRSGSPANTLMTNWGWFTTITAIIIPKMAGGLVGILFLQEIHIAFLKTHHPHGLMSLVYTKTLPLLGTGPTNSVGAATLIEPAKVALAAGVIAAAGTVAIVSKESLQRSMMRSGVKVEEILKELKHRKGMWVCYVRGSTLPTKENKGTCCPEVIHGYGVGKTQNIAHEAAKRYASSRTPKGCTAKHESNNYKCAKW